MAYWLTPGLTWRPHQLFSTLTSTTCISINIELINTIINFLKLLDLGEDINYIKITKKYSIN